MDKKRRIVVLLTLGVVALAGTAAVLAVALAPGSKDTTSSGGPSTVAESSQAVSTVEPQAATEVEPMPAGPEPDPASSSQAPVKVEEAPVVVPDPDFKRALLGYIDARYWRTDFSRHTVPLNGLVAAGPIHDGIPPVNNPKFVTIEDASKWLVDNEPVIAFELNGDARAYPLQILMFHEIVNDVVGDVPVLITYCPLCNSAVAFDRRLEGVTYDFGTTGYLRRSDLVMWDRQTESWWQQITAEAIIGELAGKRLDFLPVSTVSYSDFRAANPDGKVEAVYAPSTPVFTECRRWALARPT